MAETGKWENMGNDEEHSTVKTEQTGKILRYISYLRSFVDNVIRDGNGDDDDPKQKSSLSTRVRLPSSDNR